MTVRFGGYQTRESAKDRRSTFDLVKESARDRATRDSLLADLKLYSDSQDYIRSIVSEAGGY